MTDWWFDEYRDCPQPFDTCRPGACNCDGVFDAAQRALELKVISPAALVRCAYLAGVIEGMQEEAQT